MGNKNNNRNFNTNINEKKIENIVEKKEYLKVEKENKKIYKKREYPTEIKSTVIFEKENFIKTLNNRFKDLDEIFKIFEEQVGKNKWTLIPNKNLYFNKNIMACYPNFLNNTQSFWVKANLGYDEIIRLIKDNQEYKKYNIKWDIQTYNESLDSFYDEWHPMEIDSSHSIVNTGNDAKGYYFIYREKNESLSVIDNRNSSSDKSWFGNIIPIYRLGDSEDYILFEDDDNYIFSYSNERIFKIFLEKELIIDKIYNNNNLKKSFENLSKLFKQYKNFIKDIKKIGNNLEIVWNLDEIFKEVINNKDKNKLFKEIKVEITYSNNDKEIRNYDFGNLQGKANFLFSSGDKEDFSYNNGVRQGETKFTYKNGDSEFARYSNGKIQGNATYLFSNGDKEEFSYSDGIRQGKTTITYKDRGVETAIYSDGKIQGEGKLIYKNGDIETRYYKDGVIQGEAKVKKSSGETIAILYYKDGEKKDITKLSNLLNIDKVRVNLDKYDENILADPNRGHWDIFENKDIQEIEKSFGRKIYGRDPRLDIKKGGIVGIDFGTKSTVVVFQDDKNITLPMRISGGTLNKDVENNDYENPTVIEFINIKNFMKDYKSKAGRTFTKWEDITVSHTAFQNLINGTSAQFSSTISDLKQWAGSKKETLVVKDKNNTEQLFKPYLELKENDIDPIEIYAYYIGSYINNMRNGIYLEYFLSFPVTYEKAIREKILASFERGIKKSLPETLINDEKIMKKFKVKHGANEPAAYSVCALQEYGFEPEDDEKIYYGVFDFGGGTLDFDFGIWRASEDERSYDYELEHFGAGGDRYLGGENILKELAYEVFKNNLKTLRENNISFYRPIWCDKFMGDENLVDESQEAKLNIKLLMEKLRGLWEKSKEENYSEPNLKLGLFNKKGELKTGISLAIDSEDLEKIINQKIRGGINNFFIAMERAFKNEEYDKLYILLAGNSCKHPSVISTFGEVIKEKNINAEILPALGTEEAYKKLEERKISFDRNDKTKPTGKTGVAYGIISSRSGGRINIINRDENENENNEINFRYFIGYEGRKKFKPVLTPQTGYENFVFLLNVTADVFDLYYSSLPEASEGKMPIEKAKKERVNLEQDYDDGEKIYIKAVSSDTLEYVITKDDITNKNYLEKGTITLG